MVAFNIFCSIFCDRFVCLAVHTRCSRAKHATVRDAAYSGYCVHGCRDDCMTNPERKVRKLRRGSQRLAAKRYARASPAVVVVPTLPVYPRGSPGNSKPSTTEKLREAAITTCAPHSAPDEGLGRWRSGARREKVGPCLFDLVLIGRRVLVERLELANEYKYLSK